jgi:hypothetical protein
MLLKLTTTLVVFLIWAPVAQAWSWPVQGPVLQAFSYDETHPYAAGQHRGIDIGANATGDPVVAPESGTVSFAGFVPTSGESLTIETADGYSVTLTHLGSIGVAEGATVAEGDAVGTIGPSGTPEESVPYVHLGIRLASDPLGYLDPLGFLPAPAAPPPTPTPAPSPQPVQKPVHVPRRSNGAGLVVGAAPAVPQPVATPAEPSRAPQPQPELKPKPKPHQAPAADTFRTDAPEIRRPVVEPDAGGVPAVPTQVVHAIAAEPLALSVAPGIVAAVLALLTVFMRSRRPAGLPANVIAFRKELPLRRAA